jgi:molybdopterin-binding protein
VLSASRICRRREQHSAAARSNEANMKISARNVLAGKVTKLTKGTTTAHVVIDIGGGKHITSSITNEAVDDLDLKVGKEVSAIIKSSDVLVATK